MSDDTTIVLANWNGTIDYKDKTHEVMGLLSEYLKTEKPLSAAMERYITDHTVTGDGEAILSQISSRVNSVLFRRLIEVYKMSLRLNLDEDDDKMNERMFDAFSFFGDDLHPGPIRCEAIIDEGSIKIRDGKLIIDIDNLFFISLIIGGIYTGISEYGSLRQGLEIIFQDVGTIHDYLSDMDALEVVSFSMQLNKLQVVEALNSFASRKRDQEAESEEQVQVQRQNEKEDGRRRRATKTSQNQNRSNEGDNLRELEN